MQKKLDRKISQNKVVIPDLIRNRKIVISFLILDPRVKPEDDNDGFLQLIIDVSTNNPELILKQGQKILARHSWLGHLDLAEKLIPEIDKFLKNSKIKLRDLEKITARKNKKSQTTSNIAQVTTDVLQWAKSSALV